MLRGKHWPATFPSRSPYLLLVAVDRESAMLIYIEYSMIYVFIYLLSVIRKHRMTVGNLV